MEILNSSKSSAYNYKTGRTLGQGTFATVKEVVKITTGEKFAAKLISKKSIKGREKMVLNEIHVLKKISQGHPNLLNLWDMFETTNHLYIIMDLCTGGELFQRIVETGMFMEDDAIQIIKTVTNAVNYLHGMQVVHRDIKPENLLYKDDSRDSPLLIADFGFAKYLDPGQDGMLKSHCGTLGYMAPEMVLKTGHGKAVDMWAIGVIAFFLLSGRKPFENNEDPSIQDLERIKTGTFEFLEDDWDDVSQESQSFISALLVVDPSKRLKSKEALAHPWLAGQVKNTKDLLPKVQKGFDPRKKFRKIVDAIRAISRLSSISFKGSRNSILSRAPSTGTSSSQGSKGSSRSNHSLHEELGQLKINENSFKQDNLPDENYFINNPADALPDEDYFLKNPPLPTSD